MIHHLKTWPHEFDAIQDGKKTFDVRSNLDRSFGVGDVLILHKWDPASGWMHYHRGAYMRDVQPVQHKEKSDTLACKVTYVLHGGRFNLPPGICAMSFEVTDDEIQ